MVGMSPLVSFDLLMSASLCSTDARYTSTSGSSSNSFDSSMALRAWAGGVGSVASMGHCCIIVACGVWHGGMVLVLATAHPYSRPLLGFLRSLLGSFLRLCYIHLLPVVPSFLQPRRHLSYSRGACERRVAAGAAM